MVLSMDAPLHCRISAEVAGTSGVFYGPSAGAAESFVLGSAQA